MTDPATIASAPPPSPTILDRWEISAKELTEAIDANPSLRGMLFGYIAEHHLRKMWFSGRAEISSVEKFDDHDRKKKGDLYVNYKGTSFKIESKSLQTASIMKVGDIYTGKAQCDASDRRAVKFEDDSILQTTCLLTGEFDILAVNVFAFEEKWRFVFAKNSDLPRSTFKKYSELQRSKLLASLVTVTWPPQPPFRDEPYSLLDELITPSSASESSPQVL